MKTDDLVALLARSGAATEANAVTRRYAAALGWGAFGATLLVALTQGVRPDIADAARLPMFWIKLAFPAALVAMGLVAAARLSRPGVRLGKVPMMLAAPVIAMWALAAFVLANAAPGTREDLLFGFTWTVCPANIAMMSIPPFVGAMWAMRGLAPTRQVLAGATAGLLAGAIGALAYALHCPEMEAPFLAIWYVAGMLIPTVAGALLGPFILRW